jgi:hypothetical protein
MASPVPGGAGGLKTRLTRRRQSIRRQGQAGLKTRITRRRQSIRRQGQAV